MEFVHFGFELFDAVVETIEFLFTFIYSTLFCGRYQFVLESVCFVGFVEFSFQMLTMFLPHLMVCY